MSASTDGECTRTEADVTDRDDVACFAVAFLHIMETIAGQEKVDKLKMYRPGWNGLHRNKQCDDVLLPEEAEEE